MGYFGNIVSDLMTSGRGNEAAARKIIESIDMRIYEPMRAENPHAFWSEMRNIHEVVEGCHYNKDFAEWEVAQMEHIDKSGVKHKGAHWTIEQVNTHFVKERPRIKAAVTLYDFFVALNSWWHDNICLDVADFGEDKATSKNIERAIHYFFMDDDAPEGKIWLYYKGMHSKCE